MTRYRVELEPHGSLLIGGYAVATGTADADTAGDAAGLLVPGSSVKGALREATARLVRGAGRGREVMERLFGQEDGDPGLLSVGPLRPSTGPAGSPSGGLGALPLAVRHHVSLERWTRQAAPGLLFEQRVSGAAQGVVFRGELSTSRPLSDDERGLLAAAIALTDQVGGGRGRGLGYVRLTLSEARDDGPPAAADLPEGVSTRILVLEVEEPIHLTGVKDPGNYTPSRDTLDGSTIRGAVAAILSVSAGVAELERVFGGRSPVVFGDGRPGSAAAIPAPATLRESKRGGVAGDEAVALCAEALARHPFERPADTRYAKGGSYHSTPEGWVRAPVVRRTITRAARDHASGRAADAHLYSLEVIDPFVVGSSEAERLLFYVPVTGDRQQLELVLGVAAGGLRVGGDRSRGFGSLRLLRHDPPPPFPALAERHRRWVEAVGRLGVPRPESTGALLALGPWSLRQGGLERALAATGLELVEGVARRRPHGGWNTGVRLPRTITSQFQAGSTFVVRHREGASALAALRTLEAGGLGPGRPDGWGRLAACHPIHVDLFKEEGA